MSPPSSVAFVHLAFLAIRLLVALVRPRKTPAPAPAPARVDARGVTIAGERVLARGDVQRAWVVPRDGRRPVVHVEGWRGERYDAEVASVAAGREIVRSWRRDVAHAVIDFRAARFLGTSMVSRVPVMLMLGVAIMLWAWVALPLALVPLTALAVMVGGGVHVAVGADGVSFRFGQRAGFVPVASIERVERRDAGVVLHLRSGGRVPIAAKFAARGDDANAIAERIESALEERERAAGSDDATARLVAPRGRCASDWLRALKDVDGAERAGYREAPVTSDALWRVVEDTSAPCATRVGAAVALRVHDGDVSSRVRAAAGACASPRTRVALLAAADPEEEEEQALRHAGQEHVT